MRPLLFLQRKIYVVNVFTVTWLCGESVFFPGKTQSLKVLAVSFPVKTIVNKHQKYVGDWQIATCLGHWLAWKFEQNSYFGEKREWIVNLLGMLKKWFGFWNEWSSWQTERQTDRQTCYKSKKGLYKNAPLVMPLSNACCSFLFLIIQNGCLLVRTWQIS